MLRKNKKNTCGAGILWEYLNSKFMGLPPRFILRKFIYFNSIV